MPFHVLAYMYMWALRRASTHTHTLNIYSSMLPNYFGQFTAQIHTKSMCAVLTHVVSIVYIAGYFNAMLVKVHSRLTKYRKWNALNVQCNNNNVSHDKHFSMQ